MPISEHKKPEKRRTLLEIPKMPLCAKMWIRPGCCCCLALALVGSSVLYMQAGQTGRGAWWNRQNSQSIRFSRERHNDSFFNEVVQTGRDKIWFLETSYRNSLTARAACSIESACRHNPNHTIHLLSTGNIRNTGCPYHKVLSSLGNFKSEPLNVTALLKDTPLWNVYNGGALNKSAFAVEHRSDFLRYAVLWHKGGIYLDTDVIVLKSLSGITNSAVYERDDGLVASSVLFFDVRHPVLWTLMDTCARTYRPDVWVTCGPGSMSLLPKHAVFGRSIGFLKVETFSAVKYDMRETLFLPERTPWVLQSINRSYGLHFWNKRTKETRIVPGSGCAMDVLASVHCPLVYGLASSLPYF